MSFSFNRRQTQIQNLAVPISIRSSYEAVIYPECQCSHLYIPPNLIKELKENSLC